MHELISTLKKKGGGGQAENDSLNLPPKSLQAREKAIIILHLLMGNNYAFFSVRLTVINKL